MLIGSRYAASGASAGSRARFDRRSTSGRRRSRFGSRCCSRSARRARSPPLASRARAISSRSCSCSKGRCSASSSRAICSSSRSFGTSCSIPVFFGLIGWGEHPATAWRYFIYNFAGGLTLLLATAAFGVIYGSTDVIGRSGAHLVGGWAPWIYAGFAFAFLVKTPVWPLHTWMPPTYSSLPSPMVAVVSARAVEGGALRISSRSRWRCLPDYVHAVRGAADGARRDLADLRRRDRARAERCQTHRRVFVALASGPDRHRDCFGEPVWRSQGALVYIVAHGLFSAALFLVLGYVEEREETRSLLRLGGLGWKNPRLAGALCIAALAALGLPGSCRASSASSSF